MDPSHVIPKCSTGADLAPAAAEAVVAEAASLLALLFIDLMTLIVAAEAFVHSDFKYIW